MLLLDSVRGDYLHSVIPLKERENLGYVYNLSMGMMSTNHGVSYQTLYGLVEVDQGFQQLKYY